MRKATLAQAAKLLGKLDSGEIDRPTAQAIIEGKFRIVSGEPEIAPSSDPSLPADFTGRYRDNALETTIDNHRLRQAKSLWDKGWGRDLKMSSFKEYLATIPEVPENLVAEDVRFPDLILVDQRLSLTLSCRLVGLRFDGDDNTFEDFDPKKSRGEYVYWMRAQDGRRNRGKSVASCRESFEKGEIGLTATEGVAFYAQRSEIINGHFLDLGGSVHRGARGDAARLGSWDDGPGLGWSWGGGAGPGYGSASRRE